MSKQPKRQCAESVHNSYGVGFHPCFTNAKHREGGKWYCGTHLPSAVAVRDRARNAKFEAKWDAESKAMDSDERKLAAYPKLVEALTKIVTAWEEDEIGQLDESFIEAARTAIADGGTP